ncbi:MAG: hypothetical protein AAF591_16720 [Verrucomicrobiota bacterium]
MMKVFRRLLLTTIAPLALLTGASAQGLTSEQIVKIQERLNALKEAVSSGTVERNSSVAEIFMTASSSDKAALDFYLNTIRSINFDRYGKRETEFREWERQNEGRHDNDEFVQALRIQLRYLALTAQAANTSDIGPILPGLLEYIDGLASLEEPPHRMLRDGVQNSIFAERYNLKESLLSREESWALGPVNVDEMYDKAILPYLRTHDPSKVLSAWDRRIQQQAAMASAFGEDAEVRFTVDSLPILQWGRLKDMFIYDNRPQAAADMLAHLEKHVGPPLHPQVEQWLAEILDLMEMGDAPDAPAEPTPDPNPLGLSNPDPDPVSNPEPAPAPPPADSPLPVPPSP